MLSIASVSGIVTGDVRSAIGQFFPCPWQQSQKSLRKLTRPSSLYVLKWGMANKQPN